jgi:HSP90 family molecular chaperone
MPAIDEKQNITLRLSRETIQKARVLAAQRSTSISGLLTTQIEQLANSEDEYEKAMRRAFAKMDKGFRLGGTHKLNRDALHER